MLKIGITGHRNLINIREVTEDITYCFQYFQEMDKDIIAISALAAGADTIFVEEALKNKIPLEIILPFHPDEYKNDFNNPDLARFEKILQTNRYEVAQKTIINNQEERNSAYLNVGHLIVDNADIIIAVWDGNPASGTGGTGDIVNYARKKNKEIHIIRAIKQSNQEINNELDKTQTIFDNFDKEAVKFKKRRFEPTWITGIIAGLLAVFCFATVLVLPVSENLEYVLAVGEIIFLFTSFILLAKIAKNYKNIFLKNRRNAEYLRTLLWYRDAGIPIPEIEETEYKPDPDVLDAEKEIAAELAKIDNLPNAKRVAWTLAQGQIDYQQKTRIIPFHNRLERTEKWLDVIKIFFIASIGLYFIFKTIKHFNLPNTFHLGTLKPYLLFLAIVLPPLYAALEGIKYFSEWKRDIYISEKTVFKLKKVKDSILISSDEITFMEDTKQLREILEIENSDWAVRYTQKEVGSKI